jgi:hypothetical protein
MSTNKITPYRCIPENVSNKGRFVYEPHSIRFYTKKYYYPYYKFKVDPYMTDSIINMHDYKYISDNELLNAYNHKVENFTINQVNNNYLLLLVLIIIIIFSIYIYN